MGILGPEQFAVAKVIEAVDRPMLILSHNKTLASQLYQEFRSDGGANGKTLVTCF